MTIRLVPIGSLQPHPANPRLGNVEAIRDSIRVNGFYGAVIVQASTQFICAGAHRWQAAQLEGLTEIPADVLDIDDATALRIVAADNRTSDLAGYENELLASLLTDLRDREALEGSGYSTSDHDDLAHAVRARQAMERRRRRQEEPTQEPPPVPRDPITAVGDTWTLGLHTLICGDATDEETLKRLLAGEPCRLVVTDPPYGVAIGDKVQQLRDLRGEGPAPHDRRLEGDATFQAAETLWRAAFPLLREALAPGMPYYVFGPGGGPIGVAPQLSLFDAGLAPRHQLIWVKDRSTFSMGRLDYEYQHEPIIHGWRPPNDPDHETITYGWTDGAAHPWYAPGTKTTVKAEPGALCGYCLHPTTLHPEGHWLCEPCQPGLAKVSGPQSWKTFQAEAAKRRPKRL